MLGNRFNSRSQFSIRVAAAITGNDPWACGYRVYRGTYRTLKQKLGRIAREHGGNPVIEWRHRGQVVDSGMEPIGIEVELNW